MQADTKIGTPGQPAQPIRLIGRTVLKNQAGLPVTVDVLGRGNEPALYVPPGGPLSTHAVLAAQNAPTAESLVPKGPRVQVHGVMHESLRDSLVEFARACELTFSEALEALVWCALTEGRRSVRMDSEVL